MSSTDSNSSRINPWSIWIPIILVVLAVVITYNWLFYLKQKAISDAERPPYIDRVEDDMILTERDGREVRLNELRGKVLLVSWVYTRCPRGCSGVVTELKSLMEELPKDEAIHLVSFTLDPDDTPAMMQAFARQVGVADDAPWWFVNGQPEKVNDLMVRKLHFRPTQIIPEADRLSEFDKYAHDLRVALVDHKGHVRRLEDVVNADPESAAYWRKQLKEDLAAVLKEREEDLKKENGR
ncbi:MAG: SCO family protein [Verrucomicrobiales bacterium]|nr:SCO family protein [Verrucomicrobiales bacterium]